MSWYVLGSLDTKTGLFMGMRVCSEPHPTTNLRYFVFDLFGGKPFSSREDALETMNSSLALQWARNLCQARDSGWVSHATAATRIEEGSLRHEWGKNSLKG